MAELPLDQAIPRYKTNEERFDLFMNGGETQSFTTSTGITIPSIAKFIHDKNDEINVAAYGILELSTEAANRAELAAQRAEDAAATAEGFDPSNYYMRDYIDQTYYTKTQSDGRYYTKNQIDEAEATQNASIANKMPKNTVVGVTAPLQKTGSLANNDLVLGIDTSNLGGGIIDYQVFTAMGTWTKPANARPTDRVKIECWGGGGGGGNNANRGGGGGGAYSVLEMRVSDLPASVMCTVGSGGAIINAGGQTSFGTLLNAFGGGPGSSSGNLGGGGGGGGLTSAGGAGGSQNSGNTPAGGVPGGPAGFLSVGGDYSVTPPNALNAYGGWGDGAFRNTSGSGGAAILGGGGGCVSSANRSAGGSMYGGGGGAGNNGTFAGISIYGGSGGSPGQPGNAPAGGGAAAQAGARGEIRVTITR